MLEKGFRKSVRLGCKKKVKKICNHFFLKKAVAKKNQKKIATQNLLQKKTKKILQQEMVAKENQKFFATEMLLQKSSQKNLQPEFYKKTVAKINLTFPATGLSQKNEIMILNDAKQI